MATNTDTLSHRDILHLVRWVCDAHDLVPTNIRLESRGSVGFRLEGPQRSFQCWASTDGLVIGGRGQMAGTLTQALVGACYSATCR